MSTFVNQRLAADGVSTIGAVEIGGKSYFILEPGYDTAVHPCIPAGDYALELRAEGEKYAQFSAVFGNLIKPGLPHMLVPGREWVLVHPGNTIHDTQACSLPGVTRLPPKFAASGHWEVEHSRDAFREIYPFIRDACLAGGARWQVLDPGA